MAYKKRYNLIELQEIINQLIEQGIRFIEFEQLLIEIGFDPLDINLFYITNIKHRLRYEREEYWRR